MGWADFGPLRVDAILQQAAYQPSGNGMSGQADWLSLSAFTGRSKFRGSAEKCSCGAISMAVRTESSKRSNSTSLIVLSGFPREHRLKFLLFPD
jgi:hypothetical protein